MPDNDYVRSPTANCSGITRRGEDDDKCSTERDPRTGLYLETDERKHFDCSRESGEDVSRHIYNHVKAVSDWLDTKPGIPSAAEREKQRLQPIEDALAAAGVVTGDFADFWAWERAERQKLQ